MRSLAPLTAMIARLPFLFRPFFARISDGPQPSSQLIESFSSLSDSLSAAAHQRRLHPPPSLLDRAYRSIIRNDFFPDGVGDLPLLETFVRLKKNCYELVDRHHPVHLSAIKTEKHYHRIDGWLTSPLEHIEPGLLPAECRQARFELILPKLPESHHLIGPLQQVNANKDIALPSIPIILHLAATGDHSFWRRRHLTAIPLARDHSIGSLILETPMYGKRKPLQQIRSNLRCVFDLYRMGAAIQYECIALLHWLERNQAAQGSSPAPLLGVSGLSMGGHMASMVAATWPRPLALVSCLGPFSAAGVFTRGLLANSCNWEAIKKHAIASGNSDALAFMNELLDSITGLQRYGKPATTAATIVYAAQHDAYVPLEDMLAFKHWWPDVDLRFLDRGHVGSFLTGNGEFVRGIADSVERLRHYHAQQQQQQQQQITT